MAKQTYTTGQVLTSAQMTTLQANDYNQTVSAKVASYTLVATDAGTRITMSNASATTVTVNTSLFTAGDTLTITNIGAGVCTVTAGTATVSTGGSLALAQYDSGTLYFTSTGVSIWNGANPGDITGVTAGTGISGGGTSGTVTVTNSMATAITTNGDTLYGTGSGTFSRLGIGSTGDVLTVASGIPSWSAPAGTAQNFSLLNSGGTALTGSATVTVSGISGMNMLYVIVNLGSSTQTTGCSVILRINSDSGSNYYKVGGQQSGTLTYPITNASTTSMGGASFSSNANSAIWGGTMIFGCNSAGIKMYNSNYATDVAGGANNAWQGTSGYWSGSATVSSISIITADGTWDAGTIYIYGSA